METILILGCDAVAWTLVNTLIQRTSPPTTLSFLLYDPHYLSQRQHKYRLPYVGSYDNKTTLADAMMMEIKKLPLFQSSNLHTVKTLKTNPIVYINTQKVNDIDHRIVRRIYITKREYIPMVHILGHPIPTIVAINDYYVGYIRTIEPTKGPIQPSSNPHFLWIHPHAGHHRNQLEWFSKYETILWTTNDDQRTSLEEWFAPFESQYNPIARWVGYQACVSSVEHTEPVVLLFTDMIRLSQRAIPGKEHYDSHRNMDQSVCIKACRLRVLVVCPTVEDIAIVCDSFRHLKIASHKETARIYVVSHRSTPAKQSEDTSSAWGEYSSIIHLLSPEDLQTAESSPSFWKQLDMCLMVCDNIGLVGEWLETLPSPTLLNRLHVFHIPTILMMWNPYTEEMISTGMIPNETTTLYRNLYESIPEYRQWMDRKQRWYTVCQEWTDGTCDALTQCLQEYSGPRFYPTLANLLHQTCEYVYERCDYRVEDPRSRMECWKVVYEVLGNYIVCVPAWSSEVSELLEQSWNSDDGSSNRAISSEVDNVVISYDEKNGLQRAVWCYRASSQDSPPRLRWECFREQCFDQLSLMVMTYLQTNKIHQWTISLSNSPTIRDLVYDTELDTNDPICSSIPYRFIRVGYSDYLSVWTVWKIHADLETCLTVENLCEYIGEKTEKDITLVRIRTDTPQRIVYDSFQDPMTITLPYRLYSLYPPIRQSAYVWVLYAESEDPTEVFPPILYSCSAQMLNK